MSDGITEQLRVLERLYQVQTEAIGDGSHVRTSVFDSGRVVAIREARLAGDDPAAELEDHHRRVVEGLLERVGGAGTRGAEWASSGGGERRRESAEEQLAPDLPPVPEEPALVDGLRVRQLYGDLRRRLALAERVPEGERLKSAESVLRWIVGHPLFPKLRLDEQLRFHRLLDRLVASADPASPEEARWDDVVEFAAYLNSINHRSDIVAFDRDLLEWLDRAVRARGVDPSTLTPMRWIFGRDDGLDDLLEEVATTDREVWSAEIRRVLAALR